MVGFGFWVDDFESGSDAIADTATTQAVAHGLGVIPETVLLTPRGSEAVWVSSRDASTFTAERASGMGELAFDWLATGIEPAEAPPAGGPDSIAGLVLWLDASALTGYSDGDPVPSWTDQSGNSHHASNGNAGEQPLYRPTAIGGQPALDFDGSNDVYVIDLEEAAGDWTWFFILDPDADTTALSYLYDAGSGRFILAHRGSAGTGNPGYYDGSFKLSGSVAATGAQIYEFNLSAASGGKIYRNGIEILSAAYTQRALGGNERIGRHNSNNTDHFDGRIAEIILYNSALGSTDRDAIYAYIAAKYGL